MKYQTQIIKDSEIARCYKKTDLRDGLMKHPSLPYAFIPASKGFFKEQFYWDSFFIMQGLASGSDKDKKIVKNMLENFFTMIDKYGYVPNSYNTYDTRSQPPFLSSMVLLVYRFYPDEKWLAKAYRKLKKEYSYWNKKPKKVAIGLSRYYDNKDHLDKEWDKSYGAIQESGWDNTLRFGGQVSECGRYIKNSSAHHICPVDLNSLLYKYEKDMEHIAEILHKKKDSGRWREKARKRKKLINKYFWNKKTGLYHDYDFKNKKKTGAKTLAGFFPLWVEIPTLKQAQALKKNLKLFEHEHGLAATEENLGHKDVQWGYPNGWAPLHWIVIKGLRKYNFNNDADRITYKWLKICAERFLEQKEWEEKICVLYHKKRNDDARYKEQKITNWTEGVFIALYNGVC